MIKLVTLYPWPADPDHFRTYFVEHHLPLCRAIPGLGETRYGFEPRTLEGSSQWFCIFETSFDDEDSLDAALRSPEGRLAAADVVNYAPVGPTSLIFKAVSL
jgi:uncharacterized protein (TIGR02118 family)